MIIIEVRIEKLINQGHPRHCATRIVSGDGLCECGNFYYNMRGELVKIGDSQ